MAMFINGDAFDAEFDVDMTKPLLEQLECSFLQVIPWDESQVSRDARHEWVEDVVSRDPAPLLGTVVLPVDQLLKFSFSPLRVENDFVSVGMLSFELQGVWQC